MGTLRAMLSLVCCLVLAGCSLITNGTQNLHDDICRHSDELREKERYRQMACTAWCSFVSTDQPCPFPSRFMDGFIEGYADYLYWGGKEANPPLLMSLAQKEAMQTLDGSEAFRAWVEGFRAGHKAGRIAYPTREGIIFPLTSLPGLSRPIPISSNAIPCAPTSGSCVMSSNGATAPVVVTPPLTPVLTPTPVVVPATPPTPSMEPLPTPPIPPMPTMPMMPKEPQPERVRTMPEPLKMTPSSGLIPVTDLPSEGPNLGTWVPSGR